MRKTLSLPYGIDVSDPTIAFGAALIGALVGGVAIALGSSFVTRQEVVRSVRRQIYEMLPSSPLTQLRNPIAAIQTINRLSYMAGSRDVKRVSPIYEAHNRLVSTRPEDGLNGATGAYEWNDKDAGERWQQEVSELNAAIEEYEAWLRKRLI